VWRLGALPLLCMAAVAITGCATRNTASAPKCASGPGQPISLDKMKSRLQAQGVAVSVEHALSDQDAIAELVSESQSRLRCTVYTHPVYPKMREHPRSRYEGLNFSGKAFVIAFANIDCSEYAEGAARASTLNKLRRIFRALGATSKTVERY
jgi:hypothetical protein